MKKLLKKIALLPLFCGLILTSACSNDDENGNDNNNNDIPTSWFDGTITATVVNGNDYDDLIDEIVAWAWANYDYSDDGNEIIARGNWANGGFTITLPATLGDRFLFPGGEEIEDDFETITVSDRNLRISLFEGIRFDAEGIGGFRKYREDENSRREMIIVYADRDATVIGTEGLYTFQISLKRGWNKVYVTERYRGELIQTTEPISGLRWHFFRD